MIETAEIDAVRRFLFTYVEDLDDLVVLAWLRAQPTALGVTAEAVVLATSLPGRNVHDALARMVTRGLVSRSGAVPAAFCYAPQEHAIAGLLARVLDEYRKNPLEVLGLMTRNSIERVKTAAVRAFAEPKKQW